MDLKDKAKINAIMLAIDKSKDYFLDNFSDLVCGNNKVAVYKSSTYITKFFHYLDYPYSHDGSTRKWWVKSILLNMTSEDLLRVFYGLISKELHIKIGLEEPNSKAIIQEFRKILKVSLGYDGIPKFSNDRNLNIKQEKLQNNQDNYLDSLLDKSEELYSKGQKKDAINNLYDAFERVKTKYNDDKKKSISILFKKLSKYTGINSDIFNERFESLTKFCNNYNIRHHDKKVKILEEYSYDYIYHDILNLLNLIINVIKKDS